MSKLCSGTPTWNEAKQEREKSVSSTLREGKLNSTHHLHLDTIGKLESELSVSNLLQTSKVIRKGRKERREVEMGRTASFSASVEKSRSASTRSAIDKEREGNSP